MGLLSKPGRPVKAAYTSKRRKMSSAAKAKIAAVKKAWRAKQCSDPVDTETSELLVNNRFAYVSVSRAQYDAEIYTNNRSELARGLSRDLTQRTAIASQEPESATLRMEPLS